MCRPDRAARLPCASNHESYPSGYSHRESRTADSPPRTLSKNASRNASDARDAGARARESMTYEADSASDSDEEKCDARAQGRRRRSSARLRRSSARMARTTRAVGKDLGARDGDERGEDATGGIRSARGGDEREVRSTRAATEARETGGWGDGVLLWVREGVRRDVQVAPQCLEICRARAKKWRSTLGNAPSFARATAISNTGTSTRLVTNRARLVRRSSGGLTGARI